MSPKSLALALSFAALTGCYTPVRPQIDALICDRAARPVDLLPDIATPARPEAESPATDPGTKPSLLDRLRVPAGLPGAETPPINLATTSPLPQLDRAIGKYFPPLTTLGPEVKPVPGPDGRPLTLADLQRLARANSPLLRQAAADIEAAKGNAVQVGLYPNPTIGSTGQTPGPGGGPFYGATASQLIKTAGKLKLAQAAAEMDLVMTRLAYRKAETELMTQVRSGYYGVLVALEAVRANDALVQLTDELYRVMIAQLKGGEVAVYEPMQVGVLAAQARAALLTARNGYQLAWRQLAAALGLPALAPTELEGRATMPLPRYDYQKALAHVLANNTEVQTTAAGIDKARYNLRLAQVSAYPDVNVLATVQQDATPTQFSGPNRIITAIGMSIPLPLFDRNQGGIQQAQGQLVRAVEDPHRVRAELTARFSEAFRRYDENRTLLDLYRNDMLPKQVQAFRAAVKRHYSEGAEKVSYTDLVQAEQGLVQVVGSYLTILGSVWGAVVDVANFLQTDNLTEIADGTYPVACPDVGSLLTLPCCHPCGVQATLGFTAGDVSWMPSAETLGRNPPPAAAAVLGPPRGIAAGK